MTLPPVSCVDVHAEGESGRVVWSEGLPAELQPQGATMTERLAWCAAHLEPLRRALLREPRGNPAMCGVLVMPPITEAADISLVVLEHGGFRAMSGSNTICAVTAVLETGRLPMIAPETVVRIDTAVGLVEAEARIDGDKVRDVRVRNVPSWVEALDVPLEVAEYGEVPVDVAFGGQFYVQAPAAAMGVQLGADHVADIVRAGIALLATARARIPVNHPTDPTVNLISLAMLHGPARRPGVSARNSVVMPTGHLDPTRPETWRGVLDRSPCGTGTSARMACLHARGELGLDEPFVHEGVLGTTFEGRLHEVVDAHGRSAVIPSIRGRGWITGRAEICVHPDDPFPAGYTLGDLWVGSEF